MIYNVMSTNKVNNLPSPSGEDEKGAFIKSQDTEEWQDIVFTRPLGLLIAKAYNHFDIHPNVVTIWGIFWGIIAGILMYWRTWPCTIAAILLLVWANLHDSADGQLARMTGQRTLIGRLLDGLAGDVWFFCIYLGLVLRMQQVYGPWVWALYAYAGLVAHARQTALADYYRNIHLWYVLGKERSELDTWAEEDARYQQLHWRRGEWFEKLYLFFYRHYTLGQEEQTPQFQAFYHRLREVYGDDVPTDLRQRFRQESLPLMPLTNILTFDTRVIVLFVSLLVGQPLVFPIFEIAVLEPLRYYTRRRHEGICQRFMNELNEHGTQ